MTLRPCAAMHAGFVSEAAMKLSNGSRAAIPILIGMIFSFSAAAQTASVSDAEASTPVTASSANLHMPDQRVQEIRLQLARTSDGAERYRLLSELAQGYWQDRRVPDFVRVRGEIADDAAIPAGRRSIVASELALTLALANEPAASDRMIARAKTLAKETDPAELETLPREPAYAYLLAEGEIARRFQNRHDVALIKYREHADLAWTHFNDPALSERRHRAAANEMLGSVAELTRIMVQNNRRAEALSYAREIRWYIDHRPDLRASLRQRGIADTALAIALCSFDDYDAALEAIDSSISTFRRANVPEYDGVYAGALRMRLMIALAMGRIESYRADADALDRARSINAVITTSVSADELDSLSSAAHGQWATATAQIGESMAKLLRSQGAQSPFYKYSSAIEMLYRFNDVTHPVSNADIARYVTPLTGTDADWTDSSTRGAYVEDAALVASMDRLLATKESPETQELAFRIAELLQMNATQGSMTDGAARLAASNPALRGLIEHEQALRYEQNTSRGLFASDAHKLDRMMATGADPNVIKRQREEVDDEGKKLRAEASRMRDLHGEIAAQFPAYRELRSPSIPAPSKLASALRPNEAYVNLYAGRSASYAFVIRSDGVLRTFRLNTTRAEVKRMIVALRASFDAGIPPRKAGDLAGFDLTAASGLYQALIAPLQPALGDATTVYLATSGILASLPFNVLVTRAATNLGDANWWISTVTPVEIPSASAFVLERGQRTNRAGAPLIAFADPSFDGKHADDAPPASVPDVRAPALRGATVPADFDYRQVTPLPETLDEARSIATALGATDQSVIWGARASRSRVLKQDLSDYRVVLFATHGIIAGEVPGMRESGLALAYEGSGLQDSVLTVDDIVPLRLNADWVVLSACNTGYTSGAAGDSISALTRGFFAAGARSLLVTQWAVESRSATQLTVGLFNAYGADPSLSKADAIVRVQRDMLAGKNGVLYRHPYFWAPYFLAGDAGR
ncbi:hypothetical protein CR51_41195 [Caballeronia megalochromosomata]|nr:hypothetical protein CR51_41195 [Caballeronia megalochromosomata]